MASGPSYFGLSTPDRERARRFYSRLGLRMPPSAEPDPGLIETPTISGFVHNTDQSAGFTIYFSVDDIDASTRLVERLGGKVRSVTPFIPRHGRFANCLDDQGVEFGLHELPRP